MKFASTGNHVMPDDLAVAVNASVVQKQPLLVKGAPGTGKTEPARQARRVSGCLWSTGTGHHAPRRSRGSANAVSSRRSTTAGRAVRGRTPRTSSIRKGKPWQVLVAPSSIVLLIDGIDTADVERPNGLPQELERKELHVHKTGETASARRGR